MHVAEPKVDGRVGIGGYPVGRRSQKTGKQVSEGKAAGCWMGRRGRFLLD